MCATAGGRSEPRSPGCSGPGTKEGDCCHKGALPWATMQINTKCHMTYRQKKRKTHDKISDSHISLHLPSKKP